MSALFKVLGVLLACYVVFALFKGEVYAKSGVWGRKFHRLEDSAGYWAAVIVYVILAVALLLVF